MPPAWQCNIIPSHSQMHFKFSIILIIYLSAVELFHSEEYLFFFSNSQGFRTIMYKNVEYSCTHSITSKTFQFCLLCLCFVVFETEHKIMRPIAKQFRKINISREV